ncbi:MAG TPA: hypothetical protein DCR20_03065 [Planctomycetaceae bacterium]|nr:hypothetical protein [Planctomycetaceae bacterium]
MYPRIFADFAKVGSSRIHGGFYLPNRGNKPVFSVLVYHGSAAVRRILVAECAVCSKACAGVM